MQQFWLNRARRVAARVNEARLLEFALPAIAACCVIGGCALLLVRRNGWNTTAVFQGIGIAALGCLLAGWLRARRKRFTLEDGLVRLDARLRLHNRLTSAAAGVGPWPERVENADDGFRWRGERIATPLGIGLAFLSAAWAVPITPHVDGFRAPTQQPVAWSQVQTALDELKRDKVADPESIAALEQKLDALRQKPAEEWYSHSSLEAGDALRNEAANGFATLEKHLEQASEALDRRVGEDATGAPLEQADAAEAQSQLEQALKGLENGPLSLNRLSMAALKELASKLAKGDTNLAGRKLSEAQLQELRKKLGEELKRCSGSCQSAMGALGENLGTVAQALAKANVSSVTKCLATGAGGRGGGGGPAPLGLKHAPTELNPGKAQAVAGGDMEHAAMGDVLKVVTGEHRTDPNAGKTAQAGGSAASPGSGGEAVWKSELTPSEQDVLRRFFK